MNPSQNHKAGLWVLINILLTLVLLTPGASFADDPKLDTKAQKSAPTAFADEKPKPVLHWGVGLGKSYLVPTMDIIGEEFLLNQYDRHVIDSDVYGSTFSSFKENLRVGGCMTATHSPPTNSCIPIRGGLYHGFARSAGLDFWPSVGFTAAGSLLWELGGETGPPSINDQITTGFGGSFLGESLFRMASLLLESGDGGPGFWREVGAAAVSPATGFNRYAYGKRFHGVFRSYNPAVYTRVQLGVNLNASVSSNVNVNPKTDESPIPQSYQKGEAIADFIMTYGLPGKPGYSYTRPFDYFQFQGTAASSNVLENIISRGLLYGTDYSSGDNHRGLWGIFGSYDYIAPQIFRISSTAVSLGNVSQWWLSRTVALQGTALAGVGYGSAGTIHGIGERDYHSGVTSQGLVDSRLILGDRAAFDLELREYYVSGMASEEKNGWENITRGAVSFTVRIYNLHGITLKYTASRRDAHYSGLANTRQTVGAVSLGYTYLGQTRFGAVDWRSASAGGP